MAYMGSEWSHIRIFSFKRPGCRHRQPSPPSCAEAFSFIWIRLANTNLVDALRSQLADCMCRRRRDFSIVTGGYALLAEMGHIVLEIRFLYHAPSLAGLTLRPSVR
jgi:hypothetical protein